MKELQKIELSQEEIDNLVKRLEGKLSDDDYLTIKGLINTVSYLREALQEKKISIKRLKRLFGIKTEKSSHIMKDILKEIEKKDQSKSNTPGNDDTLDGDDNNKSNNNDNPDDEPTIKSDHNSDDLNKKKKGHGRNGASSYEGAERIFFPHPTLKAGDKCTGCLKGKLYRLKKPGTIVILKGAAPINATVYEFEKLRCATCGELYSTPIPEEIQEAEKYDESAGSMIALMHYGSGFPFYRSENLQKDLGIPLPDATQWDVVNNMVGTVKPVYNALKNTAAQGEILHNDDTTVRILSVIKEIKEMREKDEEPDRTGMFTTGIISKIDELQIAIFTSGRNHSGENMEALLKNRSNDRSMPIQMCDALSRNVSGEFKTILCNCLTHARRNFVDIAENFPEECLFVFETIKDVYHNDQITKDQKMTGAERLAFHKDNSGPLMAKLKDWIVDQFEEKKVEPNSSLGKALNYFINHWEKLTRFLEIENAPLDNNIVERALKKIILLRKNSYFFKTEYGAMVGDIFISIIETCRLNKVNPFKYLTTLQKYSQEVIKNPSNWMPWNYHEALTFMA
jgi:hypothetical protein